MLVMKLAMNGIPCCIRSSLKTAQDTGSDGETSGQRSKPRKLISHSGMFDVVLTIDLFLHRIDNRTLQST